MNRIVSKKPINSAYGKSISVINPANGELIETVLETTKEGVAQAVHNSKEGQKEWCKKPLHERAAILTRYTELVEERRDELAKLLSKEMGRPYRETYGEMGNIAQQFKGFIEVANHLYGKVHPIGACQGKEKDLQMVVREPLGTIAAIIPFNAPISLYSQKAAPALIAGNSLIVKPSEHNPLTLIKLIEMLVEAGVPSDAAQIVIGSGSSIGEWLISDQGLNGIFFTGSTKVGIQIAQTAAANLTPCFLELGGNDPFIVLDDASVDLAVQEAIIGRTINAGQICASPKRLIIHRSISQEFTNKLIAGLKNVIVGDPVDPKTDMGCLINENAAIIIGKQVAHTIEQGAKLLLGGKRNGAFFEPTVLSDVTRDMDIARDMEAFGPVFPIIIIDSLEEAIEVANNTIYGLSSSVFTQDIRKALKVANALETGNCVMNGHGFYINPDQPFGGTKMSGRGREGMDCTLQEVTFEKTITLKGVLSI